VSYGIGELARMAGISVRTLHHYDAIGLVHPAGHSRGGHRRYTDDDVARLSRVLTYRELGFALDEIAEMLADGDVRAHLRRQRELLAQRAAAIQRMAAAVEEELAAELTGALMAPEKRLAVFGDWRPPVGYAADLEAAWAGRPEWAISRARMATYSVEDLRTMQRATDAWVTRFRAAIAAGTVPDSPAARRLVEELRASIERWWFPCSRPMHHSMATWYAEDEERLGFLVRPEHQLPGMAEWLVAATAAALDRAPNPVGSDAQ
jgi:DNA-binding transcriptional MerR regulator